MNEFVMVYIAVLLTPVLAALIRQSISSWFNSPRLAPPGLYKLGIVGQCYKLSVVFISFASQFSLLGLIITRDIALLPVLGVLMLGFVSGGVLLFLCRNITVLNILLENLIAPSVLAINLLAVHYMAWFAS